MQHMKKEIKYFRSSSNGKTGYDGVNVFYAVAL